VRGESTERLLDTMAHRGAVGGPAADHAATHGVPVQERASNVRAQAKADSTPDIATARMSDGIVSDPVSRSVQLQAGRTSPQRNRQYPMRPPDPGQMHGAYIMRIKIDLSAQQMALDWSDGTIFASLPISSGVGLAGAGCPEPERSGSNCTPPGLYHILQLHEEGYRNSHGAAMPWFTEFDIGSRGIGIHQGNLPPDGSPASHGCVRSTMDIAELINHNVTNITEVIIVGIAPVRGPTSEPTCEPPPGPTSGPICR
jgi:lipoprotein-anchoring transpeptidase ErfK/SrfK